jgi:hypothetical protein
MPAFNFALHITAIFMLTFYRSAQDYSQRLRRQTYSLQSACFMVYALVSAVQLLSIWISGAISASTVSTDIWFAFVFCLTRLVVNAVAAVCFSQLRYKPEELPVPDDAASAAVSSNEAKQAVDENGALELLSLITPSSSSSSPLTIATPRRRVAMAALPVPSGVTTPHVRTAQLTRPFEEDDDENKRHEQTNLLSSSIPPTVPSSAEASTVSTAFDIDQISRQLDRK